MRSDWIARAHAFIHSNWRTLHIFRHITGFCRTTSPVPCHIRLQIASPTNTTSANTEKKMKKRTNTHYIIISHSFAIHAPYICSNAPVFARSVTLYIQYSQFAFAHGYGQYIYIYNSQSVITAYKVTDQRLCGVHICPIEAIVV